jgi:hypothetical protein
VLQVASVYEGLSNLEGGITKTLDKLFQLPVWRNLHRVRHYSLFVA